MVTRIHPDGTTLRLAPHKFGSIADAHNINVQGPWRSSFEDEFSAADASVGEVIETIIGLETNNVLTGSISERLINIGANRSLDRKVSELVASLLARSPRTRNLAKRFVDRVAPMNDTGGIGHRDPVIASNVLIAFREFNRHMAGAVWTFLYSDDVEFIYGDGHFSSFGLGGAPGHCIVPLLPTVAAACVSPIGPYKGGIRTLRLTRAEVATINELTQIYAKDYLFARSQLPPLAQHFSRAEHLMIKHHRFEWLRAIKESIEIPDRRFGILSSGLLDRG